ncbi:MAG TPA: F0F1 ATP synthase subunit B [Gemmatimonadales bacterium]|nr:F0F1 ATP synthase subunit B [Gemmatimonadales bacterium]
MSSSLLGLLQVSDGVPRPPMSPFEVNFGLFFWTWLTFGLLFFLLWKFVWPQLLGATEARERKIKQQLEEAERLNAEAKALAAEQQKQLVAARDEAAKLLAEAKAAAERDHALTTEKARAEAEELLARARREIGAEKDRASAELRREAVDLALAAAGKLIGQRLEAAQDKKIVTDYLASLESGK